MENSAGIPSIIVRWLIFHAKWFDCSYNSVLLLVYLGYLLLFFPCSAGVHEENSTQELCSIKAVFCRRPRNTRLNSGARWMLVPNTLRGTSTVPTVLSSGIRARGKNSERQTRIRAEAQINIKYQNRFVQTNPLNPSSSTWQRQGLRRSLSHIVCVR